MGGKGGEEGGGLPLRGGKEREAENNRHRARIDREGGGKNKREKANIDLRLGVEHNADVRAREKIALDGKITRARQEASS